MIILHQFTLPTVSPSHSGITHWQTATAPTKLGCGSARLSFVVFYLYEAAAPQSREVFPPEESDTSLSAHCHSMTMDQGYLENVSLSLSLSLSLLTARSYTYAKITSISRSRGHNKTAQASCTWRMTPPLTSAENCLHILTLFSVFHALFHLMHDKIILS